MPTEKALALNAHCTLGRAIEKAAKGKLVDFKSLLDANYKWLEEILDVAKQTFARPDAELLPKTPSSKRMRAVLNKRRSRLLPPPIAEEEESDDDYVPSKQRTRKMPVRSSKRTQKTAKDGPKPVTRSSARRNKQQSSTDLEASRSEAPIFSICHAEIHFSNDSDSQMPSPRQRKQEKVTVVIEDSDNEAEVKSSDNTKGQSSAEQTDRGSCSGQRKSNRLLTMESIVVDSAESDSEEGDKFKSPVATCRGDASSSSVNKEVSSCPKLTQRMTVSLGHRCSNDSVQNISGHAPSPRSIRGFDLLTVKDKVNVIEGKLDAGAIAAVVAASPHAASSKSPRAPVNTAASPHTPGRHCHSNRRSNAGQKRRSSCLSRQGDARVSLSKSRRSSMYRKKLSKLSAVAGRSIQKAATSPIKVQPIMSPRKATASVLGSIRTPEPNRCTRSKMRTKDRLHAVLSPSGGSTDSGSAAYMPVKPIRTGRAKVVMMTPSRNETQKETHSDENTATCSASGNEELLKPIRTTRAAAQKSRQKVEESETGKRPASAEQHHGRSFSAPKRQCTDARNEHTTNEERAVHGQGDSVIADTPSPIMRAKTAMSSSRHHNRLRTTPSHNTTTVSSVIRRNTPLQSQLDIVELKRQELANKDQQNSSRLQKRQELMQKRAEEQRKRREEKQLLATKRREERERTMREMRLDMIQRSVEKSIRPNQSYAMRLREERRELREKKMAEAEKRRKQEEDARQQKFATMEEEQRKHKELKRRHRDYEEQERLRRIAETERQRLQRQQELEQERRRLAERQRQLEAERAREEQERQRIRDEREKERVEREKQELERQREKEERRQEELKRFREQERQKNEAQREAERKAHEEEKRLRQIIDKYNTSLQAKSTAANTSNNMSMTQAKTRVLNTSYTVATDQQVVPPKSAEATSYEMTPPVKKYHPPSSENYNIDNISSEDSTDDEGAPKKKIPSWAVGAQLKAGLINQHHRPPDLDTIFDIIDPPDLNVLFAAKRKPRFDRRTSSAVWHSPIYTAAGRPGST